MKAVGYIRVANNDGLRDGSAGYELTVQCSTSRFFKKPYKIRTRGVVVSAGVMGTIPLLLKMRDQLKTLPNISAWLGQQVRTNSETLITANNMDEEVWEGGRRSPLLCRRMMIRP